VKERVGGLSVWRFDKLEREQVKRSPHIHSMTLLLLGIATAFAQYGGQQQGGYEQELRERRAVLREVLI
jgi:hypothetical protein